MPLPDRVTVLTCIGCGGMGRQERCEGACSEHRLPLVSADQHDGLLRAASVAQGRAARLAPVVRALAGFEARPDDPRAALDGLREDARRALHEAGPGVPPDAGVEPDTVVGWWCAECNNVDLPQPCIGVCVWRPADWVNLAAHERQRAPAEPHLRAERALTRFLFRLATVIPREGQWARNWEALREQARDVLAECAPDAPAPEPPRDGPPRRDGEPVVRVHLWPR